MAKNKATTKANAAPKAAAADVDAPVETVNENPGKITQEDLLNSNAAAVAAAESTAADAAKADDIDKDLGVVENSENVNADAAIKDADADIVDESTNTSDLDVDAETSAPGIADERPTDDDENSKENSQETVEKILITLTRGSLGFGKNAKTVGDQVEVTAEDLIQLNKNPIIGFTTK